MDREKVIELLAEAASEADYRFRFDRAPVNIRLTMNENDQAKWRSIADSVLEVLLAVGYIRDYRAGSPELRLQHLLARLSEHFHFKMDDDFKLPESFYLKKIENLLSHEQARENTGTEEKKEGKTLS